ncbi:MAG: phosphocholine cytidylyltransferase family protein [Proteobacteria bacterium]|nr:phosphocholine cytidylyltransferase family protein [Pseudomonadota bacterium]
MTRALILAAGQGTRLRPFTDDKPKCLVQFSGASLLERQVHTLKNEGITNIHVATGYRKDQIERLGYETSFNERFETTNMVESLFCAMDFIEQEGDLVISYGDIIYQQENLNSLLACDDEIALMVDLKWKDIWSLRQENPLDDAETLVRNEDNYVTELGKKPDGYDRIQGQYTGLIKIRADKTRELIKFYQQLDRDGTYDGKNFDNMYMTSFLQLLIDAGWQAKAVLVNNGWLEFDSVEDITMYEKMAEGGSLDQYYRSDF